MLIDSLDWLANKLGLRGEVPRSGLCGLGLGCDLAGLQCSKLGQKTFWAK
jgi:hypothetical protein